MFIKEVRIKNFRAFSNEVQLNLKPNTNGIEEDLEAKHFKELDNSEYLCTLASIGSANAKGKSSLLNSIRDFFHFFSLLNSNKVKMSDQENKEISIFKPLNPLSKKTSGKINEIYLNILSSLDSENLKPINSLIDFQEKAMKIFVEEEKMSEQLAFSYVNSFTQNIINTINTFIKNIIHDWKIYKNNISKQSLLSILFYDETTKSDVTVSIFDNKDGDQEYLSYSIECEKQEFDKNAFIQRLLCYGKSICHISSSNVFLDLPGYELWMAKSISVNITTMYNLVAKLFKLKTHEEITQKIIKIINIADSNIKNISFNNSNNISAGILGFIYNEGNLVSPNNISMGTLKFINTFNSFANAIINHSSLILVDEIDAYLHVSLVEFFKTWIRQMNYNVQMIFTSHNYEVLTKNMSHKQIFLIDDNNEGTKKIIKVSSIINNNKSAIKALMEQRIGSHPSQIEIDECVWDIIDEGNSLNE